MGDSGASKGKVPAGGYFNNDDLNGECFVVGELGEAEHFKESRVVVFPKGIPSASREGEHIAFNAAQADIFYQKNAEAAYQTDLNVSVEQAAKIAFYRMLGVRNGLISPQFATAANNVKYNEAQFAGVTALRPLPDGFHDNIRLEEQTRTKMRLDFSDVVSCVAYMFRVRGHHWVDDMDSKYSDLWQKCLKNANDPGLKWEFVAHNALHAIMPGMLDRYWIKCANAGNLSGALTRRVDTAPAGVAAVRAVNAGAQDLVIALPSLKDRYKDHFEELDRVVAKVKADRWAGSINRRYYAANAVEFDEGRFAAIAAIIIGSLNAFAPDSPLLRSPALRRVAMSARITGGIVARGIATAAADPTLVRDVLMARKQAEEKE